MVGSRTTWSTGAAWLLLALLSVWIYWPGLDGPVLLDDAANLERVQALAAEDGFVADVLTENRSGPLGRPVSMASFMLDLYLLDGGIRGAKLTNVLLHAATSGLVLLFCLQLFRALGYSRERELALWVAALWLLAPLFVSTVLYMVQRMAQLATFFSLLACWAYLCWRRSRSLWGWSMLWLLLSLLAVVLAVLSKENGVLALPLLLLIELAVLQPRDRALPQLPTHTVTLARLHAALLALGVLATLAYLALYLDSLEASYQRRDFSLWERIITQPRILWLYVGQLLYAEPASLGLYHDGFAFSRGLLAPGSTLVSVIAWLLALLASLWVLLLATWRGVGFGLLFFLVAHGLESTVFPLELYFEHRNYLPAVGLFISVAALLPLIGRHLGWLRPWFQLLLALLVLRAALVTAAEVQVWTNGRVFHLVAIHRFPDSVRANENLALELATLGDTALALDYLAKAEALDRPGSFRHRLAEAMVFCRAEGAVPAERFMSWQMTRQDFRDPLVSETSYSLVKQLVSGHCSGTDLGGLAQHWGGLLLEQTPDIVTPKLFLSLALLENHLERHEPALRHVDALLQRSPNDLKALMMRLYFTALLGRDAEYRATLVSLKQARDQGLLNEQERVNLQVLSDYQGAAQ